MYKLLPLFCLLFFSGCARKSENLKIAVAANTQYALEDIKRAYEKKYGSEVELIVGSSGKLTAQIREGAPYDIFLSADMKYAETLFSEGFSIEAPKVYVYGKLVLWSVSFDSASWDMLSKDKVSKIAIANPEVAPYGQAAIESMKFYGFYSKLVDNLVFGENVSQASQYVLTEAADIGFTAKSLVLSPELTNKGKWIDVDPDSYQPIAQGVVVLKKSQHKEATEFYNFLFSEEAKRIFSQFGYRIP